MNKQEQITPSSEHLWLRVIGFVLALAVAVGAFTFAVTSIGRKESGYQRIEATSDPEALQLSQSVDFQVYLKGSSGEIKRAVNELSAVYTPALLRVSRLLDAETEYEGLANIASLNAHPGEDLTVDAELYELLLDAQEKSRAGEGFLLFAGPFLRAWQDILYLAEPQDFDPLRSDTERERLQKLLTAASDPANCALIPVDDENHVLRLEISEEYRRVLRETEQEGPVLDLGLLHDAYELRLLRDALTQAGFGGGYLSMASGVTVVLPGNPGGELCLYGRRADGMTPAAVTPAVGGRAASVIRCFAAREGEPGYYELDGVLRHPRLPASGEHRSLLLGSMVVADDPVEACLLNLRLQDCASADELQALAAASGAQVAWILNDAEQTVFVTDEAITAREDYGWKAVRK